MGQYYRAVSLSKKQFLSPYDYDNGAKLMEHSYLTNQYVSAVEKLLIKGGAWFKSRFIWAGDYADKGLFLNKIQKERYKKWVTKKYPAEVAKYPDYTEANVYDLCDDEEKSSLFFKNVKPDKLTIKEVNEYRYVINHTKKEFVDKQKLAVMADGWVIHPLPLLTSNGNGRGGGDYGGPKGMEYVGTWAGNRISISRDRPAKPYKEIRPIFTEN